MAATPMKYLHALKQYFGFDAFRDKQVEIIDSVLKHKRDVCAIMFTGSGKSLCFQFPPVVVQGMTLVISPLISLMNDQQMKLTKANIPACTLNSSVSNKYDIKAGILENKYRLVYTTPEYIITQETFVRQMYAKKLLTAIAIDESHCTSMWGNDFRAAYKALGCLKDWMPDVPIVALTATATPKVQADIIKILKLRNPLIVKTSFDRPNLHIKVLPKKVSPVVDILSCIQDSKTDPTIIYCQTRKMTDEISQELKKRDIKCGGYHAGMSHSEREDIHNNFAAKKLTCIVATIAFGMGIDSTIRRVIHYGIPKDMESYYQEIGRAGRDGLKSECILYYSLNDTNTNNYFINQITNPTYRNHMVDLAVCMKNYVFTSDCRRKYILNYFGEEYHKETCAACDNCLSNKKKYMHEFTKEARLLLQLMNDTGNMYGKIILINILRGSLSKKVPSKFKKIKTYGAGKSHSDNWWKIFMAMLINNDYIKEKAISGGNAFSLSLTDKAIKWLRVGDKLILPVPDDLLKLMPKLIEEEIHDEPEEPEEETHKEPEVAPKTDTPTTLKKPADIVYDMFQNDKKTLLEISKELNISKTTIEKYISNYHKNGSDIDFDRLKFTDDIYQKVSDKIKELNYPSKLKTIKDELPKEVSYLHIKLTQNIMGSDDKPIAKEVPAYQPVGDKIKQTDLEYEEIMRQYKAYYRA
jgi:werner syndrome ATP-dependent helicase